MNYLKVKLWGKEIGRLAWNAASRRTYFLFNPDRRIDIPDVAPLLLPAKQRSRGVPFYGDDRPIYQGLPPFIADSLPDSWGNTLFDRWIIDNKVPRNKVTPLYKLMFIGSRGMGALEYEPCAANLDHTRSVDIKSLYDISLKILEDREGMTLEGGEELTLQSLLAVGTSAGGRQMKAIIAINNLTGEIRSGQTEVPPEYEHYILKFGDKSMPVAEIETAFFRMARLAGIDMEECRLFPVEGVNHFLTRRFDRKNGQRIHVQTLAAISPEARSYEDLVAVARELSLSEQEIRQIFRRLAFNVMANNTDDHNKNFSFTLEENGTWRLAPAYDMTFIFNTNATGPNVERRLSVGGKTSAITKSDLLDFARQNNIKDADDIIGDVAAALGQFAEFADAACVTQPWRGMIRKTLADRLRSFGFTNARDENTGATNDRFGRMVSNVSISVNSKGYYEISAEIDGQRRRRFVRQNMPLYNDLNSRDVINMPLPDKIRLIELLFPNE